MDEDSHLPGPFRVGRCLPRAVAPLICCYAIGTHGCWAFQAVGSVWRSGRNVERSAPPGHMSGCRRRALAVRPSCSLAVPPSADTQLRLNGRSRTPTLEDLGTAQVVFIRHGLSTFNKHNIFTGWCDVPLAPEGEAEALEAGKLLAAAGFRFDVAHCSVLKRACTSLHRLLEGAGQPWVPIHTHWRLNERHYGALQGQNKKKMEDQLGPRVREWRRGYSARPPPMQPSHPHWPLIANDQRYAGLDVPRTESLKDTADRVMQYWEAAIAPDIRAGKKVLVVAHANTLRSLIHALDAMEDEDIKGVKIPTGTPFVYKFDRGLRPMGEKDGAGFRGRFVADLMRREPLSCVEGYRERERVCLEKWSQDPELVPEECLLLEDADCQVDHDTDGPFVDVHG